MFEAAPITAADKPTLYRELARQAQGLLHGEHNLIANAANFAALVFHALPDISWCGFYLAEGDGLVVGPSRARRPACALPAGAACAARQPCRARRSWCPTYRLSRPHRSRRRGPPEIVVPLVHADGALLGVWDVDSHTLARFDDDDRVGMEALCSEFMHALD
jgi:GAF domain-containing protein